MVGGTGPLRVEQVLYRWANRPLGEGCWADNPSNLRAVGVKNHKI